MDLPVNPDSPATRHRSHLFILVLILIFAGVLRFFSLSALGFWTDEFCSLSASDGWGLQLDKIPLNQITPPLPDCTRLKDARPFINIPGAMARDDAHPPLYFLLLRIWETFFGDSESAVRSLNVMFSLLAIALLYFVARNSVGSTTALVACLLMAVATPQIQMSQEARNYMPVLVFSLCATMAIDRLRRSSSLWWAVLLSTSLLAMMLTHYFAAGVATGLVGYAIFTIKGRSRRQIIAASAVAGLAFIVLWGPSLLHQRTVMQNGLGWLTDQAPGHLQRRCIDLLRLPVRFFAEITDPRVQWIIAIAGAGMILYLPILFVRRPELRVWISWLTASVALVAVADFSRSSTQLNWVRYTLFATPAAYVLLAAAIRRGRWKFFLPIAEVMLAILCLPNAFVPAWKIDFRTPTEIVGNQLHPGDGLVIIGPDAITDGIFFAAFGHYLPAQPAASAVLTEPLTAEVRSRLEHCSQVWIIQLPPKPFDRWSGFTIQEQQNIPYFAQVLRGHFAAVDADHGHP